MHIWGMRFKRKRGGYTFGVSAIFAANMPVPVFAVPSIGLHARFAPNEKLWFHFGIYDGNPSHINSKGEDENLHGLDFRWDKEEGFFIATEAGFEYGETFKGTYKIGFGYHTADFIVLDNSTMDKSGNYALYLTLDQTVFKFAVQDQSALNIFLRVAYAPNDRNEVQLAFEGGVCAKGLFGREDDSIGLGFAQTNFSDTGKESVLELIYVAQVFTWLCMQPDMQYIMDPNSSSSGLNDSFIIGLRGTISF